MSASKEGGSGGHAEVEAERDSLSDSNKSIMMHLIKQIRIGMDLSRVTLPAFILEPRSFLEKMTDFFYFSNDLLSIQDLDDDFDKIYEFTRFCLSGFNIDPPKGIKKPYNPIIGERFFCLFKHSDESVSRYLVEQVSHHPPITALRLENPQHGWVGEGTILFKSRFLGNSVACYIYGSTSLFVKKTGDRFKVTFPTYYARGILFGKMFMETVGKINIDYKNGDYNAEIEFKPKGFFRGEMNSLKGKIMRKSDNSVVRVFHGRWDDKVYISTPKEAKKPDSEKDVYFDASVVREDPKYEDPVEEMGIWESQKLWDKVGNGIRKNDEVLAEEGKFELEESQRKGHREREKDNIEWEPFFFTNKNTEELIDGTQTKQYFIKDENLLSLDLDVLKSLIGRKNGIREKLRDFDDFFAHDEEELLDLSTVPHHNHPKVPMVDKKRINDILGRDSPKPEEKEEEGEEE